MAYLRFLVKRILQNILVLIGLTLLVFTISRILPGDPVQLALGPNAAPEAVERMRREMGLGEPIYIQYLKWVSDLFNGDWGISLRTDRNVLVDILERLPATFELVVVALTIAILLAIPLGVIAATNKDQLEDHLSRIAALVGVSMPSFWVAILLQLLFVVSLSWFPLIGRLSDGVPKPSTVTGLYLVDSLIAGQWATFLDSLTHIILPALALALGTLAQVMRLIRSDMIEQQNKDYIIAARSYGLPTNLIQYKYMLKNAFTSSLTVIGLSFGFLMGSAFLVEIVFSWPGMAKYGVRAIQRQDFNAVVGVTLIVGIAFVTANTIVDLLYGYLDPRVRFGGED